MGRRRLWRCAWSLAALATLCGTPIASAQTASGGLRGVVRSASGAPVAGAVVVLLFAWLWGEDIAQIALWLVVTAAVMLATGLLASFVPARRALRVSPTDALKEA